MKIVSFVLLAMLACSSILYGASNQDVPKKDMVTVIDLGAKACIPCKMMVPVLDAMEKRYQGKASIVFLDIREKPEHIDSYKIRMIPTQIFFDKTGKEVYRHEGYLDEKAFSDKLNTLLTE